MKRVAVGMLAMISLSGCWGQFGGGPGARFHNPLEVVVTPTNVDDLSEAWSVEGRILAVWANTAFVAGPDPAIGDGEVRIRALDVATGAQVWSVDVAPNTDPVTTVTRARATVVGSHLFVDWWADYTDDFGQPQCARGATPLALADGTRGERVGSDAFPFGDRVMVKAPVLGCNQTGATPSFVFDHTLTDPVFSPLVSGSIDQAAQGGDLLAVEALDVVHGFDPDGCGGGLQCPPRWSRDLDDDIFQLAVSPDGTSVYVSTIELDSRVLRLDGATGQVVGEADRAGGLSTAFAVDGPTLFTGSSDRLEAFDAGCTGSCAPLWSGPVDDVLLGVLVGGGVAYSNGEDAVYAFAAGGCGTSACAPLAEIPIAAPVSNMQIAGGRLYIETGTSGLGTVTVYAT